MTKKQRVKLLIDGLKRGYPEVKCALVYNKPHELLIATRLSAQCKDTEVNKVTPAMFERYPDIESFAEAQVCDVEECIRKLGLYRRKASDIVEMCRMLRDKYNSTVPDTIEELIKLPGVGRKTANLIVGDLYGKPAIVCDTHVIRLSGRLGLTDGTKDAGSVEKQLSLLLPSDESLGFCHRLVWHGRLVCTARSPKCDNCAVNLYCKQFSK